MMKKKIILLLTVLLALVGLQTKAEVRIPLSDVPFCSWTGWGADAQSTGDADCEYQIGVPSGEGVTLYGHHSVINYANLSRYDKLIVTLTDGFEGTPRMLFNRDVDEGQWDEDESQSHLIDNTRGGWSARYFSQEGNVFTVDLRQILQDKGFVHLHAIKVAWGEEIAISSMEVTYSAYDYTNYVGILREDWHAGGVCSTEFAPAITTNDGRYTQLVETYETTTENTGELMWQEITGLPNGQYYVELYANAMYTPGRGFETSMEDGAADVVYLSANDGRAYITARYGVDVLDTGNGLYGVWAWVNNGTLRIGMTAEKPGTNWHTLQICKLTKMLYFEQRQVYPDGNVQSTKGGYGWEDSNQVFPYNYYIERDGYLFMRKAQEGAKDGDKNMQFNHYFTLTGDGQTEDLWYDYTVAHEAWYAPSMARAWRDYPDARVVYLAEAEDIPGMTRCTSDNARKRSSNAAAAYAADGPVAVTTLPAGVYILSAVLFSDYKTTDHYIRFLADDQEIVEMHNTKINFDEQSSEPFTLTHPATIYIPQYGEERVGIDLIYIHKVGEYTPEYYTDLPTGRYYLRNVATGKFWGAANNWGTQASLVDEYQYATLQKMDDGTYTLESMVDNGSNSYYFNEINGSLYMDRPSPCYMNLMEVGNGNFAFCYNGRCFGYDGSSTELVSGDDLGNPNYHWRIMTEEEVLAQQQAILDQASAEHPQDVTFLIKDAGFGRNRRDATEAWSWWSQQTDGSENFTISGPGSNQPNYCAESFHAAFSLTQTIQNVPAGRYELSAKGFYRADEGDTGQRPVFYINNDTREFPVLTGSENDMGQAAETFLAGNYQIAPISCTLYEPGTLTVGTRLADNYSLWCIWDDFCLTYYGPVSIPEPTLACKTFTENTVLLTTAGNIETERQQLDWIEGGTSVALKRGTIDPRNGHEGEGIVTEGVYLKNGNESKSLKTYVTGIEAVWAYGCTTGGSDRDLMVTVTTPTGQPVASGRATSSNYQSVVVRISGLDPNQKYLIAYTGCDPGADTGSDVVLHGVKFLNKDYAEKTFTSAYITYHTMSGDEVEIIRHEQPYSSSLTLPGTVEYEGTTYSVREIADGALSGCSSVKRLFLPSTLRSIGNQAFVYSSFTHISIPASVTTIGTQAFNECNSLLTIVVNKANPNYASDDYGDLFSKDMTTLIRYPQGKSNTYYDIPSTVTTLDVSAFHGCSKLEYVLLPEGVCDSWWAAFDGCSNLKTIVCQRKQPAAWNENTFMNETYSSATLYVPQGSVSAYRSASPWSRFGDRIKQIPSSITVTAKDYGVAYGEKLPASFDYTISEGPVCGLPVVKCDVASGANAGTYSIVVSQNTLHSAVPINLQNGTLTIARVLLTVSVDNVTKKQGDPMPSSYNIHYSGFVNGEDENSLVKKATATCDATQSSAPGTYRIKLSGADSPNYEFDYKHGTLTVVAADAIVVTVNSHTIYYGTARPELTYKVEGGQLDGTPAISCSADISQPDAGTYDIKITQGSVKNYNVSFVDGTLTVKKVPLTVSVGDYTRYQGEENPAFVIGYDGFKFNQNENALIQKPVAYCDARKESEARVYIISLIGGESRNYEFEYVYGNLTVKPVYGMTLQTMGSGRVVYNGEEVRGYRKFDVKGDQTVLLSIEPDDGYELQKLLLSGEDVTARVQNGKFTISTPVPDMAVVATFAESQGVFKIGDARYRILSAPAKTVLVNKYPYYSGHLVIPQQVSYANETWKVVGVADNAFSNCTSLISVELPASMEFTNMGISLFTGCSSLAAIVWNGNFAFTKDMLGVVDNPNLLFYASNASFVPAGIANVVVGNRAERILLQDVAGGNGNFYCPKTFTAGTISYTHHYGMTSAIGGVQGWESLSLPFTVAKMEHSTQGTIVPFAKYNGQGRPFWLYAYSTSGFTRASTVEANKPYIICMPNNEEYDQEYRLAGDVTFSAQNARVAATDDATSVGSGNRRFVPAFCMQEMSKEVYALNVVNELHAEDGGYAPGSVFVSNLRNVSPFEAYMTTSAANARMVMEIEFDETTGIDNLRSVASGVSQHVYNLNGQVVAVVANEYELQKVLKRLATGVYIVNGKKKLIK